MRFYHRIWLNSDLSAARAIADDAHTLPFYMAMPKHVQAAAAYQLGVLGRSPGNTPVTWWAQLSSDPQPPNAIVGLGGLQMLHSMGFKIGEWPNRYVDLGLRGADPG
jgi:hypothetical protein